MSDPEKTTDVEYVLSFCTRCGSKVSAYLASKLSLSVAYKSYDIPSDSLLMAEPHYWCASCEEHWLATNLLDTGMVCQCGNLSPQNNRFCGVCGRQTGR